MQKFVLQSMAKQKRSIVFKAYMQAQAMLLPPSLDELIAADHPYAL
jgi:hypothetical protein